MSPAAALREHALALLDLCQSQDVPRLRALLSKPLAAPTRAAHDVMRDALRALHAAPTRTPHEALLGTLRALHATGELDASPAVGIVAILDRAEADAVPA